MKQSVKDIQKFLKPFIPSEIKRHTSPISLILSLVIFWIFNGFFNSIGEKILGTFLSLIRPISPEIFRYIKLVTTYTIPINVSPLTIVVFVILFFPTYRFFDKRLLSKTKRAIVFEDNFDFGNKGWRFNYWGSNNPDKTCRIEQSSMVFEAEDSDLTSPQKENGACFDLTDGVYQGSKYEISCWVKSSKNTTMGFKLWVHDARGQAEMKFPANFYTPGNRYEEVKVGFIATQSQALRIHLHYKAGRGKIYVDKVKVVKV